jgi:hypothetical protein
MYNPLPNVDARVIQESTAIDLSGFDTPLLLALTLAAPSAPITFQVRESDETVFANATLVDPSQLLNGGAALNAANQTVKIGYLGSKRYLFLTYVGADDPDAAVALLSAPASAPVGGA